jgi:hypothetical protein
MAEQHLDRPDVDSGFKEVRRETLAERMDAVAVRDPRGPLGVIGDFLRGANGHRPVGIEARKHPRGWPVEAPVGTQFGQQAGGEQRVAVLAPFARLDADEHPSTVDIRALEPDNFADAQARGIGGHQEDAVPGIFCACEQALEFFDTQDLGEGPPP